MYYIMYVYDVSVEIKKKKLTQLTFQLVFGL